METNAVFKSSVCPNRVATSFKWALLLIFLPAVMAVPVRWQELHNPEMQPPSRRVDDHKRNKLLPSTRTNQKAPSEQHSHSESNAHSEQLIRSESKASVAPDFLQMESDVVDNSSHALFMALRLLQGNTTVRYQRNLANTSIPAADYGYLTNKRHVSRDPPMWPWVSSVSIIRKTNHTEKATLRMSPFIINSSGTARKHTEVDSNHHLDREERAALLKSVNQNEQQGALYSLFAAFRAHMVPIRRFMTTLDVAALTVAVLLCLWLCFTSRLGIETGVRAQVASLRVSTAQDIQNLFQMKERYDCCHLQPFSPGVVLRLQGTITPGRQGKLVAPLSRRDCVHFSASASGKRHDGIHALPIAFHSVCVDFTITLLDDPTVKIAVYGQDIALFDIKKGTTQDLKRFAESPDHWQDFILSHRASSVVGALSSSAALRSESLSLDFQEVALLVGEVVTCVGEVRRGHDGGLRLFPCEDFSTEHDGAKSDILGERWRTSWERPEAQAPKTTEKVLISDDQRLLKPTRARWATLNRHADPVPIQMI